MLARMSSIELIVGPFVAGPTDWAAASTLLRSASAGEAPSVPSRPQGRPQSAPARRPAVAVGNRSGGRGGGGFTRPASQLEGDDQGGHLLGSGPAPDDLDDRWRVRGGGVGHSGMFPCFL